MKASPLAADLVACSVSCAKRIAASHRLAPRLGGTCAHSESVTGRLEKDSLYGPSFDFLTELDLSNNRISGSLPALRLPRLQSLMLGSNQMTGAHTVLAI